MDKNHRTYRAKALDKHGVGFIENNATSPQKLNMFGSKFFWSQNSRTDLQFLFLMWKKMIVRNFLSVEEN